MVTLWLFSRYRFTDFFALHRAYLPLIYLICIYAGFISGKRAILASILLVPVIFSMFRKDFRMMFLIATGAGLLITGMVLGHGNYFELPYRVQRVLGNLPGQWDTRVAQDVGTDFRERLRNIAIDYIVEDPIFGRGGYRVDFSIVMDVVHGGTSIKGIDNRELGFQKFAMTGSWHTTWLGIAADFGIPAAVMFLLFYIQSIQKAYVCYRWTEPFRPSHYHTLAGILLLYFIISLLRSWTSGHSAKLPLDLWWQYGLLVALARSWMEDKLSNDKQLK